MKDRFAMCGGLMLVAVAAPACGAEYIIEMRSDPVTSLGAFVPAELTIQPGDTVTWVQADPYDRHNVAAYPDRIPKRTQPFESPTMNRLGERWSMKFTKPGTYAYHCHPHEAEGMRGILIVGRPSRPDEVRQPQAGEGHRHDHGADGHHHAKPHTH